MSVVIVFFYVVRSGNDIEYFSNLIVCLDIYVESILFGFIELIGKLIESLLDCVFFLFIKKIVGSNCNIFLDFEFSMLNGIKVFLDSVLGNDLDCIGDIIKILFELKIVEEFEIKEEDDSENIEFGVFFFDIELVFVEIFMELKVIEVFYVEGSVVIEESWEFMFNDDGDCLDLRFL